MADTNVANAPSTEATALPAGAADTSVNNGADALGLDGNRATGNGDGNDNDDGSSLNNKVPAEEAERKFCRDVLLPTDDHSSMTPNAVHEAQKNLFTAFNKPFRAVIAETHKLWDNGKDPIKFVFLPGTYKGNDIQHEKVRSTIKEWENYGGFHFQEVTDPGWVAGPLTGNPIIRITFNDLPEGEDAGSWSTIGKDAEKVPINRPTMNFGEDLPLFGNM